MRIHVAARLCRSVGQLVDHKTFLSLALVSTGGLNIPYCREHSYVTPWVVIDLGLKKNSGGKMVEVIFWQTSDLFSISLKISYLGPACISLHISGGILFIVMPVFRKKMFNRYTRFRIYIGSVVILSNLDTCRTTNSITYESAWLTTWSSNVSDKFYPAS